MIELRFQEPLGDMFIYSSLRSMFPKLSNN